MARSFWDRWLLKRLKEHIVLKGRQLASSVIQQPIHHQIYPSDLVDPIDNGKESSRYIGRGSFSVVRVQLYRVAVKELLPRTAQRDAIHEANQGLSSTLTLLVWCLYVCPATKNYHTIHFIPRDATSQTPYLCKRMDSSLCTID